jgi:DNA uptake protein ComE-like DNA-binding protein
MGLNMNDFITHPVKLLLGFILGLSMILVVGCADATDETVASEESAAAEEPAASTAPATANVEKINMNTGTEEQFLTIPNVGDNMVHEFEEYRPYVSIQQFRQEIGKYVDEAQVAAYEEYVFVPVSPNDSDEPTLEQLPGVDAVVAAELAAGRPYASNDAFIAALRAHVAAEQAEQARAYLSSP